MRAARSLRLLLAGGGIVFRVLMGAFPIVAAAAVLLVIAGARAAPEARPLEGLARSALRCWVAVGLVMPWLALAGLNPFLAFFGFGGPLAVWGLLSLGALMLAAAADARAGGRREPVEPTWLYRLALLLGSPIVGTTLSLAVLALLN